MLTFNILLVVILFVSFLLILVIMVQQPKGGGLSSTFGGNAQVVGGVKKTGDFLDRSTWTLGAFLIVAILLANMVLNPKDFSKDSRIIDGFQPETSTPKVPTNSEKPQQ